MLQDFSILGPSQSKFLAALMGGIQLYAYLFHGHFNVSFADYRLVRIM